MSTTQAVTSQQNWPIVILGFLVLALSFSTRAALGLVMPVWQSELGWSSSFISSVGASALIVMALIAPFAGSLVDRKGPRFTLTIGLISLSIGSALIAVTSDKIVFAIAFAGFCAVGFGTIATHVISTAVARTFEKNRGLAVGTATSGATGGQFLIVPLVAGLLAFYSWRWSFAGLSATSLLMLPVLFYFLSGKATEASEGQAPPASNAAKAPRKWAEDFQFILTKPAFHILFWSFLLCGYTSSGVIETHLLPFASYCGFPPVPSASAYGLLSAVNLLGMIGAGWLTDRVNRIFLLASIYILRGFTFMLLGSLPGTSIENLFIFAALFGAVDYATVPVTVSLVASHIGMRVMGLAMGLISAGHALGAAAGAFMGGYLFDQMGDYGLVWLSSVWLALGAGVMVFILYRIAPQPLPRAEIAH